MISRRQLLAYLSAAAAGGVFPSRARGDWESSSVGAALLDLSGDAEMARGLAELVSRTGQVTSADVRSDLVVMGLLDPNLQEQPFLALVGDAAFPAPSDAEVDALRQHLYRGGFLFVDDRTGLEDSAFYRDVRSLLGRLFPEHPVSVLPADHSIYRSFFLVEGAVGRFVVRPYLEGIQLGDITPVVVSRNDMCGAWERKGGGEYVYQVVPGGERQRLRAYELGINLVMYALTANYKRDAAHVKALLQRMRDEGRIP